MEINVEGVDAGTFRRLEELAEVRGVPIGVLLTEATLPSWVPS